MTEHIDLSHAVWSGTFRLFGIDVRCHVLSSGARVIDEASVYALMDAMATEGSIADPDEIWKFAQWRAGVPTP